MTEEKTKEITKQISDKDAERASEWMHALTPYGPREVVKEMGRRIKILDKSKTPLTMGEAIHAAQLAISTDLNPFADELWVWIQKKNGERHFNWMPGRRGIIRHANEQAEQMGIKWDSRERLLTVKEKKEMMIPPDAIAVRVEVTDDKSRQEWRETFKMLAEAIGPEQAREELGPPPAAVGIGVLTQEEIDRLPYNNKMPHYNRAAKRGLTEALKSKFNLSYGGHAAGAPSDYQGYLKEDAIIDGEWDDVEAPAGRDPEDWGGENRYKPDFWNGAAEAIVDHGLARDAFYAAEMLAHSTFEPIHVKQRPEDILKYAQFFDHITEEHAGDISTKKAASRAMMALLSNEDLPEKYDQADGDPGLKWTPEELKNLLDKLATEEFPEKKAPEAKRNVLASALGQIFEDDTARYEWSKFYLGHASTREVKAPYIWAALLTLNVMNFEDEVSEEIKRAVRNSHTAAMKEMGQQEMNLNIPPEKAGNKQQTANEGR